MLALIVFSSLVWSVTALLPVWPIPVTHSNGSEVLWIDKSVKISYNCASVSTAENTNWIIAADLVRVIAMARRTEIPLGPP